MVPLSVCGMFIDACAFWIALTACPSATPGARLNEMVTAGNWPWWLMDKYPVFDVSTVTKLDKGTCFPASGEVIYRSEEHTSELQSIMRNSYAVVCSKKQHN